jgi:gamma-glutamyltranspeptidase/glutathione hydrolase
MLNMLEELDYHKMDYNSAERIHILAEVMKRAFADRAKYLGDPDFVKVPTKGLVNRSYANKLADLIDDDKATPSKNIAAGNAFDYESSSTTHLSVVDKWGNAVSSTQTINYWFGSCVVVRGTGIILNDEMDDFSKKPGVPNAFGLVGGEANAIAARKTMLSSMSPTIVFDPKGEVELIVGSPGGPRIINATLQTILNKLAFKMPLYSAVHATRIHHQWLPDELRVEKAGIAQSVAKELSAMGHNIVIKGSVGDVQAIAKEKGEWIGVSDTRAEGVPASY